MKHLNYTALALILLAGQLRAQIVTLAQWDGSNGKSPSYVANGFQATALDIANEQPFYQTFGVPWSMGGNGLLTRATFSISSTNGTGFTITGLSFDHAEYLFNLNGGQPPIIIEKDATYVATMPWNYYASVNPLPVLASFSLPLNITNAGGYTVLDINEIPSGGGYGTPRMNFGNITLIGEVVPEPATAGLLSLGILILAARRREKH